MKNSPQHDAFTFPLNADFALRRQVVDLVKLALNSGLNEEGVEISPVRSDVEVCSCNRVVGFEHESLIKTVIYRSRAKLHVLAALEVLRRTRRNPVIKGIVKLMSAVLINIIN